MHANCRKLIDEFAAWHGELIRGGRFLEIGSLNVNGSARDVLQPLAGEYLGIDLEAGNCVDRVHDAEQPIEGATFDVICSFNALEHSRRPWRIVQSAAAMLRSGGLLFVVVPFQIGEHRFPIDCWRFLPDGMRVLFEDAGLKVLHTRIDGEDTVALGRKD